MDHAMRFVAVAALLLAACDSQPSGSGGSEHAARETSTEEVQAARVCADITGHALDAPEAAPSTPEAARQDEYRRCLAAVLEVKAATPPPLRGRTEAPG
jgi:hypothetical protein